MEISPGDKFSRLTVQAKAAPGRRGISRWQCLCDCGAERIVNASSLKNGNTKSCGCFWRDKMRALKTKHGGSQSKEFATWLNMRARCNNPNLPGYELWGGRGIKMCERWNDFAAFLDDMGPKPSSRHSLDRIDVNGDYEPANCRWATPKQQNRNRRVVELIRIGEQARCLTEWCEIYGINYWTVRTRMKRGASLVEALSRPALSNSERAKRQYHLGKVKRGRGGLFV